MRVCQVPCYQYTVQEIDVSALQEKVTEKCRVGTNGQQTVHRLTMVTMVTMEEKGCKLCTMYT